MKAHRVAVGASIVIGCVGALLCAIWLADVRRASWASHLVTADAVAFTVFALAAYASRTPPDERLDAVWKWAVLALGRGGLLIFTVAIQWRHGPVGEPGWARVLTDANDELSLLGLAILGAAGLHVLSLSVAAVAGFASNSQR